MDKTTKKLKDDHRAFLVTEFACFATPKQAADALKQEFGIRISPQGAQHYDVTSGAGSRSAKKWKALFAIEREAFTKHAELRIPEAFQAVRIQKLALASREFEQKKNFMAMADMLERIAKECGNVHTNRREVTGKGGGAIQYEDVSEMSDAAIRAELRVLLNIKDDADLHPAPEGKQ